MKKRQWNCIELLAIYFAKKSVKKSIPVFTYIVKKPKNIETIIKEVCKKHKE